MDLYLLWGNILLFIAWMLRNSSLAWKYFLVYWLISLWLCLMQKYYLKWFKKRFTILHQFKDTICPTFPHLCNCSMSYNWWHCHKFTGYDFRFCLFFFFSFFSLFLAIHRIMVHPVINSIPDLMKHGVVFNPNNVMLE